MKTSKWDARIRRAHELATTYSFAAEGLRFYERITQFQKSLYSDLESQSVSNPAIASLTPSLTLSRPELDFIFLLPRFRALLSLIEGNGPAPLASSASGLRTQGEQRWQDVLAAFWQAGPSVRDGLSAPESLMAWNILRIIRRAFQPARRRLRAPFAAANRRWERFARKATAASVS